MQTTADARRACGRDAMRCDAMRCNAMRCNAMQHDATRRNDIRADGCEMRDAGGRQPIRFVRFVALACGRLWSVVVGLGRG